MNTAQIMTMHVFFVHLVVAYVEEADADLAHEIQCVLGDSTKSFDQIFSRNKMLRRKINAKKARSIE